MNRKLIFHSWFDDVFSQEFGCHLNILGMKIITGRSVIVNETLVNSLTFRFIYLKLLQSKFSTTHINELINNELMM